MFEIQSYYSFILAILLFQLFPGAGTVAILTATATGGVRSGMSAVYGTLLGDFIYMSSAVLGLAAVLQKFPAALTAAQYVGVVYLCYLGLKKLFGRIEENPAGHTGGSGEWTVFRQALAICLTNPKAIMFFMAFFPLFMSQGSGPVTLLAMMAHVTLLSLVYQAMLVLVGNRATRFLARWRYSKVIATRLAGIALLGFGLKLARNIK